MKEVNVGRVSGLNAYELAVKYKNFDGTLDDWMESLKGRIGITEMSDADRAAIAAEIIEQGILEDLYPDIASGTDAGLVKDISPDVDIDSNGAIQLYYDIETDEGTIISTTASKDGACIVQDIKGVSNQVTKTANKNVFYASEDMSTWATLSSSFYDFTFDGEMNKFGIYTLDNGVDCMFTPITVKPNTQYVLSFYVKNESVYTMATGVTLTGFPVQILSTLPTSTNVMNVNVGDNNLVAAIFTDKTSTTLTRYYISFTSPTDTSILYLVMNFGYIKDNSDLNVNIGKFQLEQTSTATEYLQRVIPCPSPLHPSRFFGIGETPTESVNMLNPDYISINDWYHYPSGYNFARLYTIDTVSAIEVRTATGKESAYIHLSVDTSEIYTFSFLYSIFEEYTVTTGRSPICVQVFDVNPFNNTMTFGTETVPLIYETTVGSNHLRAITTLSNMICNNVTSSVTFTSSTGDAWIVFNFGGNSNATKLFKSSFGKFQLEYGGNISTYTYPVGYENVIDNIMVTSMGKNLFNSIYEETSNGLNTTGITTPEDWIDIPNYTKLKGSKQYTIIVNNAGIQEYEFGLFNNMYDEEPFTNMTHTFATTDTSFPYYYTFTTPSECIIKGKIWRYDTATDPTKIMIVEGFVTTATDYVPHISNTRYIDGVLRGFNSTIYDEYTEDCIVQRITGEFMSTDKTDYSVYNVNSSLGLTTFKCTPSKSAKKSSGLCAYDIGAYTTLSQINSTVNGCTIGSDGSFLFTLEDSVLGIASDDTNDTRCERCGHWFESRYIRMYYELATPEYHFNNDVDSVVRSYDGYTCVYIENAYVNPTLKVKFTSKTKGLQAFINELLTINIAKLKKIVDDYYSTETVKGITNAEIDTLFTSPDSALITTLDGRFVVTTSDNNIISN